MPMKKQETIGVADNWPADQITRRPVADLIPYARNARVHTPAQIASIAASIREWGWTMPILVDDAGTILAGHGRLLAAQQLGLDEVPCMVAEGWSEAKRRAYVLADNRLTDQSTFDMELVSAELQDLAALDYDLALVGWDGEELAALLEGSPDFEPGTEADQGKLDELAPKIVTCPHCGEAFDLREHEQG